jgi:N utilization substance protein B
VIELLYESEIRGVPVTDLLEDQVMPPAQMVSDLVLGVSQDIERIDAEIDAYLHEGWSLDRLGILDLWILRLGVHELQLGNAPVAVVINEAVELGNRFGATDESGAFINGVLGSAARDIR